MFVVYFNNKVADVTGYPQFVQGEWGNAKFSTLERAQKYARAWADPFLTRNLEVGDRFYFGSESNPDVMEIREVVESKETMDLGDLRDRVEQLIKEHGTEMPVRVNNADDRSWDVLKPDMVKLYTGKFSEVLDGQLFWDKAGKEKSFVGF